MARGDLPSVNPGLAGAPDGPFIAGQEMDLPLKPVFEGRCAGELDDLAGQDPANRPGGDLPQPGV